MLLCENCGTEVTEGAVYCGWCGKLVETRSIEPGPSRTQEIDSEQPEELEHVEERIVPSAKRPSLRLLSAIAGILTAVIVLLIVLHPITSPISSVRDSDGDGFPDVSDAFPHDSTEWKDSDNDGVGDNRDSWENQDSDRDGLTNSQETELGSSITHPDLFLEIDYMTGLAPTEDVLAYLASYYYKLGITVHAEVGDEISDQELHDIGVTPVSLSSYECVEIEREFHDDHNTHVYVFYAKYFDEEKSYGWSSESIGAFLATQRIYDE